MKSIRHIQKCFSPLLNLLCFIIFLSFSVISCGGGGGGAGGASIPASEYSTHNAGGWGGSGSSGGGNGGNGNGVNTTGGTPLVIDHYVYNGATYTGSQIQDLIAVIQNDASRQNTSFTVQFYVAGDSSPREAKVTKGYTVVQKFEHQYKATCTNTQTNTTFTKSFYTDTGLDLTVETTTPNMAWLCAQNGQRYGSLIAGIQGDIALSTVFNAPACEINLDTIPTGASGPGPYEITNLSGDFGFSIAYTNGNSLPDGTTYVWKANGYSLSADTGTCSASPADANITESRTSGTRIGTNAVTATTLAITCDVTIPGEPTVQFSKQIKVFKRPNLSASGFGVALDSKPSTAGATAPYAIWNTSDTFTFAVDNPDYPADTSVSWYITDQSETTTLVNGNSITAAQMGTISTNSSTPTSLKVHCTISHADMTNASPVTRSMTVSVYKVSIPAMKISVTGTPSQPTDASGAYHVGPTDTAADSTQGFTYKVERDGNTDPIPTGVTYQWLLQDSPLGDAETSDEKFWNIYKLRCNDNTVPTFNENTFRVKCRISLPGSDLCNTVETAPVNPRFAAPKSFPNGVTIALNDTDEFVINSFGYYVVGQYNWNSSISFGVTDTSSLPTGYSFSWSFDCVTFQKPGNDPIFSLTPKEFWGNNSDTAPSGGNTGWSVYYTISAPGYENKSGSVHITMTIADIGTKAPTAEKAVGDIVFADGSASPYNATLTNAHKHCAVAVIFYTGSNGNFLTSDSRTLGVGLQQENKILAANDSKGSTEIVYATGNGAANMNVIKALSDYGNGAKYPAVKWVDEYRRTEQTYNSGWFIPSKDELLELIDTNVMNQVNLALNNLDATSILANTEYWSSTFSGVHFAFLPKTDGSGTAYVGNVYYEHMICPVHEFP